MKFLVGTCDSDDPADATAGLRIIDANSVEDALKRYRVSVLPNDEEFLQHLADKSINLSFSESFWLEERDECIAFEAGHGVICGEDVFEERVREKFKEAPQLADAYLDYLRDRGDADISKLPEGLAEFIAGTEMVSNWVTLFATPLDSIPSA